MNDNMEESKTTITQGPLAHYNFQFQLLLH